MSEDADAVGALPIRAGLPIRTRQAIVSPSGSGGFPLLPPTPSGAYAPTPLVTATPAVLYDKTPTPMDNPYYSGNFSLPTGGGLLQGGIQNGSAIPFQQQPMQPYAINAQQQQQMMLMSMQGQGMLAPQMMQTYQAPPMMANNAGAAAVLQQCQRVMGQDFGGAMQAPGQAPGQQMVMMMMPSQAQQVPMQPMVVQNEAEQPDQPDNRNPHDAGRQLFSEAIAGDVTFEGGAQAAAGALPSPGSALHGTNRCNPCAWFWKPKGCLNASNCCYCHLCPEGELKQRKKAKVVAMRMGALEPNESGAPPQIKLANMLG